MRSLAVVLLLSFSLLSQAADLSRPVILVASPELRDDLYAGSVLVVRPFGVDQHVGFIVNRPTGTTLGALFPEHGPSQKVVEPVYRGGPVDPQVIFALVWRPDSPGGGSFEMLPGLFAAFQPATFDRIVETDPAHARFVAGLVIWRPNELASEVERGAWHVLDADAALVMRSPEGMWDELVRRSVVLQNTIRVRFTAER